MRMMSQKLAKKTAQLLPIDIAIECLKTDWQNMSNKLSIRKSSLEHKLEASTTFKQEGTAYTLSCLDPSTKHI